MKRIIVLIVAALVFSVVHAAKESKQDECQRITEIAEALLSARNSGVTITKQLETNDKIFKKKGSEAAHRIFGAAIRDVYRTPLYQTKEAQKHQIVEFTAMYYDTCMSLP